MRRGRERKTPFWWGRDVGAGHAQCDGCGSPTKRQTSPVGSFRPNGFGLYDTAGNAAEWVEDCWNDNYRNAPKDASAWTTGDCHLRVLRGGNFTSKAADVRSAARFRYDERRALLRQRFPRRAGLAVIARERCEALMRALVAAILICAVARSGAGAVLFRERPGRISPGMGAQGEPGQDRVGRQGRDIPAR